MLVFSLLVIFIFNFALEMDAKTRNNVTSGVLWVTLTFAGTLGLNRSMAVEKDRGCLDGLLLAPVDRTAIYFGKTLANLIFMLLVAVIILPVYRCLYNVNLFMPGLFLVILFGAVGICRRRHPAGQHGCPGPYPGYPAADFAFPGRHSAAGGGGQSQQWLSQRPGDGGNYPWINY